MEPMIVSHVSGSPPSVSFHSRTRMFPYDVYPACSLRAIAIWGLDRRHARLRQNECRLSAIHGCSLSTYQSSNSKSGIDHSTAGAQFVWNYFPIPEDSEEFFIFRQIIALCIASHHNSALIDCFRGTMPGDDVFSKRMENPERKPILMKSCPN